MKKISRLTVVLIAVLVAPVTVLASPPSLICGSVTDGSPAPVGTEILAEINTIEVSMKVKEKGNYCIGIPDRKDNEGKMITFKISGITDSNQLECVNINTTSLINFDLSVLTPETPPVVSSGGGGGGGSYTPPSSKIATGVPLEISSTQTGTLNQNLNKDNKVKVEIPKGSIKSVTTFTVASGSLENDNVPKDKTGAFLFNGLVFNVEAVDTTGKNIREFSENLTITLTVLDLPDDTSNLGLYYFDKDKSEWIEISDVSFRNNMISFKVNHLTQFAVFDSNSVTIEEKTGEVKGVTDINIIDGDIIQCKSCSNPFAVYIVKQVGEKNISDILFLWKFSITMLI